MENYVRTSVTFPFSIWKTLKALAAEQRKPLNTVIIELVKKGLGEK